MSSFAPLANAWRFKSKLAGGVARLAFLGFLAGLGFIPGWHRLLGFSGFFGFFGLAVLIETVARLRRCGN
jgi:hypothetical protein